MRLLIERKARLIRWSKLGIPLNEHITEEGTTVFEHACKRGAEGIVSKRIDAPYRSGPCSTTATGIIIRGIPLPNPNFLLSKSVRLWIWWHFCNLADENVAM